MPELPEIETTRRGIEPCLLARRISGLRVRERRLRWPVPRELESLASGQSILAVGRRAKYLLISLEHGGLILHLGMSGSLRVLPEGTPAQKHDHLDLLLDDGNCLRLRDPRRFGAVLWQEGPLLDHPLLRPLGLEPLTPEFTGDYLRRAAEGHRRAVKSLVMDNRVVVGVGNIYCNEALFRAGIHPQRGCDRISVKRYRRLADCIKEILTQAIEQGGTTLRDFHREDGRPGYFALALQVYGKAGSPCPVCATPLSRRRIGQRSSFFCPHCQR
jgi:formamidopyrimidine-DNA glycosylase